MIRTCLLDLDIISVQMNVAVPCSTRSAVSDCSWSHKLKNAFSVCLTPPSRIMASYPSLMGRVSSLYVGSILQICIQSVAFPRKSDRISIKTNWFDLAFTKLLQRTATRTHMFSTFKTYVITSSRNHTLQQQYRSLDYTYLFWLSDAYAFKFTVQISHSLLSVKQAHFDFLAAISILKT